MSLRVHLFRYVSGCSKGQLLPKGLSAQRVTPGLVVHRIHPAAGEGSRNGAGDMATSMSLRSILRSGLETISPVGQRAENPSLS